MTEAVNSLTTPSNKSSEHKELSAGRIKRDSEDFQKIKSWFNSHSPFDVRDHLVALDSGLVDENHQVTCDRAESIGASIHVQINGKTYTDVSFKRSNQLINLQALYSNIKVNTENISVDPLTLFLRLAVIVEKKPEKEIEDYFYYELTSFPMSLFKDGVMRSAQKHKLKDYLTESFTATPHVPTSVKVVDGGALLWCCNWNKGETFANIFDKYIKFLNYLKVNVVVFDGYEQSTKDTTRSKRGSITQAVEIHESNPCPSDRSNFFSNYTNKKSFIRILEVKLRERGLTVYLCHSDADTTIVKVALNLSETGPVTVFADDTDILCLLLHHYKSVDPSNKMYLTSMIRKQNRQRECYNIGEIIDNTAENIINNVLFAHAFTGCDTTSAIHNFGKTSIFRKLEAEDLCSAASTFYEDDKSPDEIGNASIRFFQLLHSSTLHLQQIRKQKYEEMITSDRAHIDPSVLPPSPRAAYYHGLRVYHQVRIWRSLIDRDIDPLDWGWKLKDGVFSPIATDEKAGPEDILKVVRCGCKGSCSNRCSCRKMGLHCTSTCATCRGIHCTNVEKIDEENDAVDDRNFLDAFF
jgi:hypothetical protein